MWVSSNNVFFFSIIEQTEQMEGQYQLESRDLNANGLVGFVFKIRKKTAIIGTLWQIYFITLPIFSVSEIMTI